MLHGDCAEASNGAGWSRSPKMPVRLAAATWSVAAPSGSKGFGGSGVSGRGMSVFKVLRRDFRATRRRGRALPRRAASRGRFVALRRRIRVERFRGQAIPGRRNQGFQALAARFPGDSPPARRAQAGFAAAPVADLSFGDQPLRSGTGLLNTVGSPDVGFSPTPRAALARE